MMVIAKLSGYLRAQVSPNKTHILCTRAFAEAQGLEIVESVK